MAQALPAFVEATVEAAVFAPVKAQVVLGGVEAGFGAVEDNLAMFAHPKFFDGVYGDEGAAEALDAFGEAFDGGVFDGFEDEKTACADQVMAADPGLKFFLGLKGIHGWPRCKEVLNANAWRSIPSKKATFLAWQAGLQIEMGQSKNGVGECGFGWG
jgi:hypothetical protein